MSYSIKEVSQKVGLSIYTLRFYDKQGLLHFVARNDAGYREFTDGDLNLIHTICCLKETGMKISDIRQYIEFVMAGPETVDSRKNLLLSHRQEVLEKQKKIEESLQEIDYKIGMYSSEDAKKQVALEVNSAIAEKEKHGLSNPYAGFN